MVNNLRSIFSWIGIYFFFLSYVTLGQSRQTSSDSLAVRRDSATRQLHEVTVRSRYYHAYNLSEVSNTLRVQTPLLELSQNIQEINKDILADQQILNLTESISRNVSGAIRNNISDFYSTNVIIRGATINTLRNGVDISPLDTGPFPEDPALIEQMEFIKGPAGFMNAIGDPAGSFNVVTKQPTGKSARSLSLSAGSYQLYRGALDLDGKLTRSGKLLYRLNAMGVKSNSFVKFNKYDKILIAPVVKYQISANTALIAEYSYQKVHFLQYSPTVFSPRGFASLPIDFTITDPNLSPYSLREQTAFLTLNHTFSRHWSLTARGAMLRSYTDGRYLFVREFNKTNPTLLPRTIINEDFLNQVYSGQAFVNGNFTTGSVGHRFVAGLDANRKEFTAYRGFLDNNRDKTVYPLDIDNPVYGLEFVPWTKNGSLQERANTIQTLTYLAVYAQDEARFFNNTLRLTVAGRFTHAEAVNDNRTTVVKTDNTVFTPRFGLSYSLRPDFTAYAIVDHTFTPQGGAGANGEAFKPLRGQNLEIGLKKDWMGGLWNTTLALYAVRRSNQLVADPAQPTFQAQLGKTVSKGLEFDLKGQVANGLNVVLNYAYSDSYIADDTNPANIGLPTPYLAKHLQNTWLSYTLPVKYLKGLGVLAGYQYQVGRTGRYPVDKVSDIADNFRLDGGLTWANRSVSVNLLVNNWLNQYQYTSAWTRPVGYYTWVPLAPRNFRLTVTYRL